MLNAFHGDVSPETRPGDDRRTADRVIAWHARHAIAKWTCQSGRATNDCEVYG